PLKGEKGFILPYSFVLSILLLTTIAILIHMYENELKMTQRLMKQVQIETLAQMIDVDIGLIIEGNGGEGLVSEHFRYPYGQIKVEKVVEQDDEIFVKVLLTNGELSYPYYWPV